MPSTDKPTLPQMALSWQEEEVHLSDYLHVLLRRKTIFLIAFFTIFILVALYTFMATPIYQASGTLHVRDEKGKVDLLGDLGLSQGSPIESEIEILKSRTNVEEVVRRLHLDWQVDKKSKGVDFRLLQFHSETEEPVYRIELAGDGSFVVKDADGKVAGQGRAGERLRGDGFELLLTDLVGEKGDSFRLTQRAFNPTVQGVRGTIRASELGRKTNIIRLAYTHSDPTMARDVVNTLTQVFLERSVTLKTQEASKSLEFIAGQLQSVRQDLDAAEKQLEQFKSTSGLVQLDVEAQSLIERLAKAEGQMAAISVRKKQVEFAIESLADALAKGENYAPAVMADDPVIAGMAQILAEYEVQKQALSIEYTEAHPAMQAVLGQIAEVQRKLLATYRSNLQDLSQQYEALRAELSRYDAQLKLLPEAERQLAHLARQAKVNADIYTFLLQKHEEARILRASTMSNIDVIDPAIAPDRPVKPHKKKNLLLGLIVGLMVGVGLAFFLEYMDDTLKDSEQIKRLLGLPILVTIPFLGRRDKESQSRSHTLVSQLDPKAPAAEAFRSLRTGIHFSAIHKTKQVLMVSSSFPGEGKTTISANLAVTLAQTGGRVIIIGCDLRKPALHEFFEGHRTPGLTEVLVGDESFESAVNLAGAPGVDFLSSGSTPPNPAELLASAAMTQLLTDLRQRYDHIILDAPPMLAVTDATVLSPLADLLLVTFEVGRSNQKTALMLRDQLNQVQAPIAGLVLNDKTSKGASYYGGYYGGYYGSYYGDSDNEQQKSWWQRLLKK